MPRAGNTQIHLSWLPSAQTATGTFPLKYKYSAGSFRLLEHPQEKLLPIFVAKLDPDLCDYLNKIAAGGKTIPGGQTGV